MSSLLITTVGWRTRTTCHGTTWFPMKTNRVRWYPTISGYLSYYCFRSVTRSRVSYLSCIIVECLLILHNNFWMLIIIIRFWILTIENIWTDRVSSRGGMSLEQFAIFRLVVSIAASIQAEIEDRALRTLVHCCWILNKHKSCQTCAHWSSLDFMLSRDLEVWSL